MIPTVDELWQKIIVKPSFTKLSDGTQRMYQVNYKTHIKPKFGHKLIIDDDLRDIKNFIKSKKLAIGQFCISTLDLLRFTSQIQVNNALEIKISPLQLFCATIRLSLDDNN